MKRSIKIATGLLGLGLASSLLQACQTDTDPVGAYQNVQKNAVAPSKKHYDPVVYNIDVDPQSVVTSDFLFVEKDPLAYFIEGDKKTIQVKVTPRIPETLNLDVKVSGLEGATIEKDPKQEFVWNITWTPKAGFVNSKRQVTQHAFDLRINPIAETSDPKAMAAVSNDVLDQKLTILVYKDSRPPVIAEVAWEKSDSDATTERGGTIYMKEGTIKKFSVRVKSEGASQIGQPELTAAWSSIYDDGKNRILRGTDFVKYDGKPEKVAGKNEWIYHMVFDTKNLKIAYPDQIASNKGIDQSEANYRIKLSAFEHIQFEAGEKGKDSLGGVGPKSEPFTLDFRVAYDPELINVKFSWDDGESRTVFCPGMASSYDFLISSEHGIGQIKTFEEQALAGFKKSAPGESYLTCDKDLQDQTRVKCQFEWFVPANLGEKSYALTMATELIQTVEGKERVLRDDSSTESIKVSPQHEKCKRVVQKAQSQAAASSAQIEEAPEAQVAPQGDKK